MKTIFASRVVALAARLQTTEFGVHTIKTGKMAGQVVTWGKHLPAKMPFGSTANRAGTMQVTDPVTKATMTIQRGIDKLATNTTRWQGGRRAYIANINIPQAHRNTFAGGKSLQKMTKGVFEHMDHRGISATTLAGAYEKRGSEARIAGTHALVQGYQKRGFKIDSHAGIPNSWNVPMTRKPGATPVKPMSRPRYEGYMGRQRDKYYDAAKAHLKDRFSAIVPGAATAAGAAAIGGTAVVAETKNKHQDAGKKILLPALAAGGVVAGIRAKKLGDHFAGLGGVRKNAREMAGSVGLMASMGRIGPGRALAANKGVRGAAGKALLRGLL